MAKTKGRPQGIDDKAYGTEPVFNKGETPTEKLERARAYGRAANWYNYFFRSKDHRSYVLKYAKEELKYSATKLRQLKLLKDYELSSYLGHPIRLYYRGWEFTKSELKDFKDEYSKLYELSRERVEEIEDVVVTAPKISPRDRMISKVHDTIGEDFDQLLDSIQDGDFSVKFDVFKQFKIHGLKSPAVDVFRDLIQPYYEEIDDAYNKKCEQAQEAYSHIKRTDQRKLLKLYEGVLSDCNALKDSFKATRMPRAKKPKTADKQVDRLKYCVENMEAKLTSINPVMIPGSMRLYTYNVKTRKLTEYVSTSINGFTISGSTLKSFDPDQSRVCTLRKPEDIIPQVIKKTPNQIDKVWKTLTTKTTVPNGRINGDTILLRALTK